MPVAFTMADLIDPAKADWRLFRVWVIPVTGGVPEVIVQPVTKDLPSWWADVDIPPYTLVLGESDEAVRARMAPPPSAMPPTVTSGFVRCLP